MDNLPNTDWSLIRSFLAVAETGSLSAAARLLRSSQPTLGRQIKQLETELGCALFLRQPRGFDLTDAGQMILPAAKRMRQAMSDLSLTAAGQDARLAGVVRITASEVVAQKILPPIIARIRRDYPEIEVDLRASDHSDNLLFREADIAIRMYRPEQLEIVTKKLGEIGIGVCAAQSYLDRYGVPETPEQVRDHRLVGYDQSELILRGMRQIGLPATRDWFATRCDDQNSYWELVKAGCGIGFGQRWMIATCPDVVEIDLGIPTPALPVWLATPQSLRQTGRVSVVWELLEQGLRPFVS